MDDALLGGPRGDVRPGDAQGDGAPVIPGHAPYAAVSSPYSLAVDDKNQTVWTNDFNSGRIYRLDARTGASTEYLMPEPEIRDLTVDESAARPTVWIPVCRPPAKMVKVEVSPN